MPKIYLNKILLTYISLICIGVPGPVSNIIVNQDNDIITVRWDAAKRNGADIINYLIRVLEGGRVAFSITTTATVTTRGRDTFQTEQERERDVVYVATISARNAEGQGPETTQNFTVSAGNILLYAELRNSAIKPSLPFSPSRIPYQSCRLVHSI